MYGVTWDKLLKNSCLNILVSQWPLKVFSACTVQPLGCHNLEWVAWRDAFCMCWSRRDQQGEGFGLRIALDGGLESGGLVEGSWKHR